MRSLPVPVACRPPQAAIWSQLFCSSRPCTARTRHSQRLLRRKTRREVRTDDSNLSLPRHLLNVSVEPPLVPSGALVAVLWNGPRCTALEAVEVAAWQQGWQL